MSVQTDSERITARARSIADREQRALLERTSGSAHLFERAVRHMPMGVASSFQAGDPYPIYLFIVRHAGEAEAALFSAEPQLQFVLTR